MKGIGRHILCPLGSLFTSNIFKEIELGQQVNALNQQILNKQSKTLPQKPPRVNQEIPCRFEAKLHYTITAPTLLIAADVLSGVRQKSQVPGALDSHSQTPLVFATGSGFMTRFDLASICQKVTKKPHLLVINDVNLIYAQKAFLTPRWSVSRSPLTPSSTLPPSTCQVYLLIQIQKGISLAPISAPSKLSSCSERLVSMIISLATTSVRKCFWPLSSSQLRVCKRPST